MAGVFFWPGLSTKDPSAIASNLSESTKMIKRYFQD